MIMNMLKEGEEKMVYQTISGTIHKKSDPADTLYVNNDSDTVALPV